jgi:hypothetical protein
VYTTKQFKTKNYRQQLSLVFALIVKTERKGEKSEQKQFLFFSADCEGDSARTKLSYCSFDFFFL